MTKSIKTYEDLEAEKMKLQQLLKAQRELIHEDIAELKEELRPMGQALSFIGKITTRDRNNALLTEGADRVIDLLVKKLILGRSGWITRLLVPFFMKNYSSHFLADHKDQIIDAIKSFFTANKNGQEAPEPV
jgi:hypothetical protein